MSNTLRQPESLDTQPISFGFTRVATARHYVSSCSYYTLGAKKNRVRPLLRGSAGFYGFPVLVTEGLYL